jgi:DNA-binding NtrC family response regulator
MKRRILLADDEPSILRTLKTILEVHGFEIETAASSKEAISKLGAGPFHLVLTDMRMEHDEAGYDVIQAAQKTDYDPATVILTAFPLLGSDGMPETASTVLVKPMNAADLLHQIEMLLVQHEGQKQQSILARETSEDSGRGQAIKKTA